ncbi:MAG: hypothetical protein ACD_57C00298G0003 [uncultured bacterium]|nr:MAG: hypothetical protein ACD_57C00298G0003 [uncultured bacterium]KKR55950.1 MAG: hypothetical protein UT95_C0059G0008 [Candidatus Curtissbacteria bacterium GW2011_GWB1_40_28]KKR59172.1 MAG: hypothetical protein UT99_C0031G0003 [Candidatus Curtissbacteria bacterium GW2011_GWA2_40_31]KKR59908.1 MAG: hypothetical protein UU00_C0041G0008 [Microgenomates group bacterium GW2011_GWC1_40_35]KKR64560.1 MAG: hypothetical protein UU05_C0049G0009 [Candidatus Curtissbacteria bacterium GW2011_GWA1_40_47]
MFLKIIFIIAGIAGIVATFYVSWFWRGLIIPMVIILLADVVWEILKKK